MRLKKVKGAKEIIENSMYYIPDPKLYRGKFKYLFFNNQPIYIEVGTGKGDFIIENAKKYPNINFIGIEKFDSVLVRAIEKAEKEEKELPNLKFIRMDALSIDEVFDKEIERLYLNFSDPWPKNRHEHRRLSSTIFLKKYDGIFKDIKEIHMKTDNRKFFEFSLMSMVEYGYKLEMLSLNLYEDSIKDNIPTEYETRFVNLGMPIYKGIVKKMD